MQQPTRIYLDNAATTPLSEVARSAMRPYLEETFGNASSPYAISRTARMAIDTARAAVAALIGAHPDEIVFTSGGTESDNWALLGTALRILSNPGERATPGHILVSAVEHHAILEAAATLGGLGFEIETIPVNSEGLVSPDDIAARLRPETRLVSVMTVNNEIGTIQPIAAIAAVIQAANATNGPTNPTTAQTLFHTDAVQAAGKIDSAGLANQVDLLSLSAHKFGGPKGAGALYVRRGIKLHPLLRGGGQERGRRAGTENVPAIVGMGAAATEALNNLTRDAAKLQHLRDHLESGLSSLPGAQINGTNAPRAPHIANVSLKNQRAESLALALDMQGFAVGTGSACASGALEPSHVLAAMGHLPQSARSALRISLGIQNTKEELNELLSALTTLLSRPTTHSGR